jgi:3-oxoacyl-[acyl-carrier-protein] synthase II
VLTADKVLVTIGTACSMSAVGSTETYLARVANAPEFIAYAAFDAGLIGIEPRTDGTLQLQWRGQAGGPATATLEEIETRYGAQLRRNLGIRYIDELSARAPAIITEIAAGLPHNLASGGLRELAGLHFRDVRDSALRDMYGLFDDDPRLGPSVQAQLFVYAGMGALAALPQPLSELLPNPYDFRVAGATAFAGIDALRQWRGAGHSELERDKLRDRFAMRLASALSSHGPALVSTLLAPSYPLSKSLRNPALLDSLKSPHGFRRVPQTPLNTTGACASSSIAFCELAPQMLLDYPGLQRPGRTGAFSMHLAPEHWSRATSSTR